MAPIYISLGGDEGDPMLQQIMAAGLIEKQIGTIELRSSFFQTEPWGVERKEYFVNSALKVHTELDPSEVLRQLLGIERQLGRTRSDVKNEPRIIDLDLIYYGDLIVRTSDLQVPHPNLHLRRFVLEPLNEIAPELFDPFHQMTVRELLAKCQDPGSVQILECATTI